MCTRALTRLIFALTTLACAWAGEAVGQGYPVKPIRLIVPFSAGGPTDAIARIVAQKLSESVGQQVIVDNRPGANAIIGTELGAKSAADGYTLVMVAFPHAVNPSLHRKLPYDTLNDFAAVTLATSGPMLLAVHPSVPATDVRGLIALARARPGDLTSGSSGTGSTAHLALALLNHMAGTRIMHVPYKGAAQGVSDLLGGHVSMYFGGVLALLPHVKSGKVRGLAVSTRRRSDAAPNIPTVAEAGVRGYEVSGWYGVVVPARTPKEIIARLNSEIVRQLRNPEMKEKLAASGAEVVASTPEQFASYIGSEITKWSKVMKAAGIRADQ
ncbi:MAG: tripartite tricarboxylate transporter substrate binding protein [Betaproteobacteria bacterium]|nr:tripartite tricarboxylate transporter substrate binding protein [Betaproteobacteria bacterium]MBI3936091.1 tripartite tricarboxylate transporter substrate binding protein [Betaproteobacteria bacterium]